MSTRCGIIAILVVSLLAAYSCKSVETTSAMLHNEHGNYEKAIEMANLAIEKNPMDAEAHFQLGIAYSYTQNVKDAYAEFRKAAELDPKKTADVETNIKSNWARHFNQGLSEFQTENLAGAVHEFGSISIREDEIIEFARRFDPQPFHLQQTPLNVGAVHLAGSGPVMFTVMNDRIEAENLKEKLANRGVQAFTAVTFGTDKNSRLY